MGRLLRWSPCLGLGRLDISFGGPRELWLVLARVAELCGRHGAPHELSFVSGRRQAEAGKPKAVLYEHGSLRRFP